MRNLHEICDYHLENDSPHSHCMGVMVEIEGCEIPEIIVNPKENFPQKLEYYKATYDEYGNHKFAKGIRIVDIVFGVSSIDVLEHFIKEHDLSSFSDPLGEH